MKDQKPKRTVFKDDEEGQYAEYLYLKGMSAPKAKTAARVKTLNAATAAAFERGEVPLPAWLQALQVRPGHVGNKPSESSNS